MGSPTWDFFLKNTSFGFTWLLRERLGAQLLYCLSMHSRTLKRWLKIFHKYYLVFVCLNVPALYLPSFIKVAGYHLCECIGEQIIVCKIVVG